MALAEVYTRQQELVQQSLGGMKRTTDLKMETIDAFRRQIPPCFPAEASKMPHKSFNDLPRQKTKWHCGLVKNGHWTVAKSMMDEAVVEDKRLTPLAARDFTTRPKTLKKPGPGTKKEQRSRGCQEFAYKSKILTMLHKPTRSKSRFTFKPKLFVVMGCHSKMD